MDANGSTQKKKVTMAEFFDYPEYAYNEKGQLKNWVAGPNPWIPAATVGLLSLLGGIEEAEGGGYGLNLDSIVDAGLLGTKTYLEGTQNLQNQRKDYYDHNLRSQQQLRENLKFQHETEDRELLKKRRRSMVEGLPNLFKELEKTNIPDIKSRIPVLRAMAESGKIESAYQTTANLASQIGKVTKGIPEMITLPDGKTILVQKDSEGSFSVVPGQSFKDKPFGFGTSGSLRGKAMGIIYQAKQQGKMDDEMVMLAYDELKKPRFIKELQPDGTYMEVPQEGYVPPTIQKWMEEAGLISSTGESLSTVKKPKGPITGLKDYPKDTKDSFNFANRMGASMGKMDDMYARGYEPSRKVIEFLSLGFPGPHDYMLKAQREAFLQNLDANDRIFAGNAEDWIRAKLRRESGAAIAAHEVSGELSTYFYQPKLGAPLKGRRKVMEDFRRRRIEAFKGQVVGAGNLWTKALKGELTDVDPPRTIKSFQEFNPFKIQKFNSKKEVRNQAAKLLKK